MKNLLAILTLSAGTVFAYTGTLNLSGTIPSEVSILVSANGAGTNMDLTASQTDLVVATVSEASNTTAGYEVYIKTTNGGSLNHVGGDFVSYTGKYGATSVTMSTTDQLAKTYLTGGVHAANVDFSISYTGVVASSVESGSYTDTVTFTIQSL